MTSDERDQKAAIVLAAVERLASVHGLPIHDYALVGETDLDLPEIRDLLTNVLAGKPLDLASGEEDGSIDVIGTPGTST